jgi:hypothetical protein
MVARIEPHSVARWIERVATDADMAEARTQMVRFLATASVEGQPRNWMRADYRRSAGLQRGGPEDIRSRPCDYAYNDEQPGVCLILTRASFPMVLTVVTRQLTKAGERRYQQVQRHERNHGRIARQRRYERSVNEG